jgi:alpha-mannosidase
MPTEGIYRERAVVCFCSSVDEGDVLAFSPESVIRQVLYGNEYFQKEFGKQSWIICCRTVLDFRIGCRSFITLRTAWFFNAEIKMAFGCWLSIQQRVWQGPDGKSVIVAFRPGQYNGSLYQG